jgi:hypothetical protein
MNGLSRFLPLNYEPSIPGLEVIEPKTLLDQNLALIDFRKYYGDMDEMGQYATQHFEELK